MSYWLFKATILAVLITVRAQKYTFGQSKYLFEKCIEDYLRHHLDSEIGASAESIAETVSQKFYNRSFTREQFIRGTISIYYNIKNKKISFG